MTRIEHLNPLENANNLSKVSTAITMLPEDLRKYQQFVISHLGEVDKNIDKIFICHDSPGGGFYHAKPGIFTVDVMWNLAEGDILNESFHIKLTNPLRSTFEVEAEVTNVQVSAIIVPDDRQIQLPARTKVETKMPQRDAEIDEETLNRIFIANMVMGRVAGYLSRISYEKSGNLTPSKLTSIW